MAGQLQTARRRTDNSRECSCSSMTQLSTPQLLNNSAMRFGAETRSTFYVFVKESKHIGLPLRDRKVKEVVSVLRSFTDGRINFQQVRLVQTFQLTGQSIPRCSAVIVGGRNQHDRSN